MHKVRVVHWWAETVFGHNDKFQIDVSRVRKVVEPRREPLTMYHEITSDGYPAKDVSHLVCVVPRNHPIVLLYLFDSAHRPILGG